MSLVKSLKEATGKATLWDVIKSGGLSIVLDGNWGQAAMQLSGGTNTRLVGEDVSGNKYYEDKTRAYGRHRWVIYRNMNDYSAATVTPAWHAWINYVSDEDPVSKPPIARKFDIAFKPAMSGTTGRYLPKGSWENPTQRNWGKMSFWQPPGTELRQ